MDGDTVVAGALLDDDQGPSSGSVYVFTKPAGGWASTNTAAKLTASDGDDDDRFGRSVSVDGDTVVVGSDLDDDNGDDSGSAYVFTKPTNGGWASTSTAAKLTASDGNDDDRFGRTVAVDGDTVVVGSDLDDDNGDDSGSAYVFTKPTNGGWASTSTAAKLTASDGAANDWFGRSITLDGDTVVVGAWQDDDKGWDSGSVYVYQVSDWTNIPSSGSGETNTISYTVTGLTNDAEYDFWIRAVNSFGKGAVSETVTVAWFPAPTNLVAATDSTRIVLQWDTGNSAITNYLITSLATGSGQDPTDKLVAAGSGTRKAAAVTSLTNGTQYTFTVQAAAVSGGQTVVIGFAASVTATPSVNVPAAPTGFTATPGHGQVRVTWDNPNNITIRKYQYSTDEGTTFNHMDGSGRNTTSFTLAGLPYGTEYRLDIRASNLSGESVAATVTATTPSAGGVLVSNTGNTGGSTSNSNMAHAQAFTTGGNTAGYPLDSITLDVHTAPGDGTLSVSVRADGGSGNPGGVVYA